MVTEMNFGHLRSARERASVDAAGCPIPWYTYPATRWLEQLDFRGATLLEYGSGNSTRWWADRAQHLVSVEHDPSWHARISEGLPGAVDYRLVDGETGYVGAADDGPYDVIVVDGAYRPECARAAIRSIQPGGLIVFDNSDWYPKAMQLLRSTGAIQIDFVGLGPITPYAWATSMFIDVRAPFKFDHTDEIPIPGRSTTHVTGDH